MSVHVYTRDGRKSKDTAGVDILIISDSHLTLSCIIYIAT